jgi:hypothetical protein
MKLPPWRSNDPKDQRAFTRFVIEELEREDDELLREFAAKFLERADDPEFLTKARDQLDAERLAKLHGGRVEWLDDKARQGNPGLKGDFARAVRDVRRIREIFRKHWPDKVRRTHPPSAEQIAAVRWKLTNVEATRLHKKFHRG